MLYCERSDLLLSLPTRHFNLTRTSPQRESILLTVPPESEHLKRGLVQKKVLGRTGAGHWEERQAVFTDSLFVLSKPGEDTVRDFIPLVEIECAVQLSHDAATNLLDARGGQYLVFTSKTVLH